MKLSISTLGCPGWDFPKVTDFFTSIGVNAIEARLLEDGAEADEVARLSQENAPVTFARLNRSALSICCFGSSANFNGTNEQCALAVARAKATIDVCARVGIPFVRVFGDKIPEGMSEADQVKRIGACIKELCDHARGKQVEVLMEVHGDFNTADRVCAVVDSVGSPEFGILWDIAHSDKTVGDDYESFYRPVKPFIRHIHIKDHKRVSGKFVLCSIGEGDIPIAKIVNALLKDGFNGFFSYEWEKRWHPELAEPEDEFPRFVKFMNGL